ncbi:LOW QUALITY PROTEIN: hepatic sodium/bile acid cotransporter [Odontesthes bonariensis]
MRETFQHRQKLVNDPSRSVDSLHKGIAYDPEMASLLLLLHLLPSPPGGLKSPKISACDAVERLVVFHKSCWSLEEHLCNQQGRQPYLLTVGRQKSRIDSFYIPMDKHPMPGKPLHQELFKAHFVFNLSYDAALSQPCPSSSAPTMDHAAEMFSEADLLQNDGFAINVTAANTSSLSTFHLSPVMDKTVNILLIVVLFITMVSLGCTMEVSKIKDHIVKPKGVAIAVLSQYGVMPLTAFCLAKGFQLPEIMAVVILICGCCPGGALSNILALALKGDMNLSIVMTSCSTLLALGMMPLLLYLYCQGFPNLQNAVPYVDIIISLVMILLPCGAGILLNYYRPQFSKIITKVGITIMMISVVVIGIIASVDVGGSILTVLSPPLMAIAALMPFIGYSFGYIISSLFGLNQSERRTVAMETGCQNIQLCSTVLKIAFPRGDRASVSVPAGLRVLSADGGDGAHPAVQVLPKVDKKRERALPASNCERRAERAL